MRSPEEKLIELCNLRARTYGLLSRLYRVEVDQDTLVALRGMNFPTATGNERADKGYSAWYNYLRLAWDDSVRELAIDYVRTFIGHGVNGYSAAYPYESVYTSERRLMMQEARGEVLAILREAHLIRDAWNEGEDHIAIECEYMQRMALRTVEALEKNNKEAAQDLLEKQLFFVEEHLLNWVPMLAADMHIHAQTDFYRGLADVSLGFMEEDQSLLHELLDDDFQRERAPISAA